MYLDMLFYICREVSMFLCWTVWPSR